MKTKLIFNETGTEELSERSILDGNTTNLFNLNNVKYQWANNLYTNMMNNFWIPEKVSLTDDVRDYRKLTPDEKVAYDGILSFLVFLDSIQVTNLPNIAKYITAPEVSLTLTVQTFFESIHSKSYAYIIESIVDKPARDNLYEKWREDEVLLERNRYIASIYQDFENDPSNKNFMKTIIANYLLESIYFYNGFNFFYTLTSRNLMNGTANIIKLIQRDELLHVVLFKHIINEIKKESPEVWDAIHDIEINEMFKMAVEQEIKWSTHIIKNVLGISDDSIEQYTKFITNERLEFIGMSKLFTDAKFSKNPYVHLERIADLEGEGSSKANFFETTVTSYNMSSALPGWDTF